MSEHVGGAATPLLAPPGRTAAERRHPKKAALRCSGPAGWPTLSLAVCEKVAFHNAMR